MSNYSSGISTSQIFLQQSYPCYLQTSEKPPKSFLNSFQISTKLAGIIKDPSHSTLEKTWQVFTKVFLLVAAFFVDLGIEIGKSSIQLFKHLTSPKQPISGMKEPSAPPLPNSFSIALETDNGTVVIHC